jgi:hypothetical protein
MEKWLDRIEIKPKILKWLESDSLRLLVNTTDSSEIIDIENWFFEEFELNAVTVNISSFGARFKLLEDIISEFGRERFPQFTNLDKTMETLSRSIEVRQEAVTDNKAVSLNVEGITQTVTINVTNQNTDLESKRIFACENKINEFLESFIVDLSSANFPKRPLIICSISADYQKSLSKSLSEFEDWFSKKFIRKITKIGVKIIVLCSLDSERLRGTFDHNYLFKLERLNI